MSISFDQLVVECGRLCNMQCPHCLRGCAQNAKMPIETMRKFLSQVDSLGSITFSGGEPMLYGNVIAAIVDEIIARKIYVGHFYMATNGKSVDVAVLGTLLRLRAYCGEPELCALELSLDQFHEPISEENKLLLSGLSFFSTRGENLNPDILFREGRAELNGLGRRTVNSDPEPFRFCELGGEIQVEDTTYINVFGELFPECDFSYETQQMYAAWNIFDHPVSEIIRDFARCDEEAA